MPILSSCSLYSQPGCQSQTSQQDGYTLAAIVGLLVRSLSKMATHWLLMGINTSQQDGYILAANGNTSQQDDYTLAANGNTSQQDGYILAAIVNLVVRPLSKMAIYTPAASRNTSQQEG